MSHACAEELDIFSALATAYCRSLDFGWWPLGERCQFSLELSADDWRARTRTHTHARTQCVTHTELHTQAQRSQITKTSTLAAYKQKSCNIGRKKSPNRLPLLSLLPRHPSFSPKTSMSWKKILACRKSSLTSLSPQFVVISLFIQATGNWLTGISSLQI